MMTATQARLHTARAARLQRFAEAAILPPSDAAREWFEQAWRILQRDVQPSEMIDRIIAATAAHYFVTEAELLGGGRANGGARPRQVAIYLARELTLRSLYDIGRHFEGRDHSTILWCIRRIEKLSAADAQLRADIGAIRREVRR